jgi:hypothetical protein
MAASEPAADSIVNDDRREEWTGHCVAMRVFFCSNRLLNLKGRAAEESEHRGKVSPIAAPTLIGIW